MLDGLRLWLGGTSPGRGALIGMLLAIVPCVMASRLVAQQRAASASAAFPAEAPRIMVVPYVKAGEDLRTVLEADSLRRLAVASVREALDARDISTVDLVGRLKAAEEVALFTSNSQSDIKQQLIQFSGADIFVQVEAGLTRAAEGNSASVTLTAYETATGTSIANRTGRSGASLSSDDARLVRRAVETTVDGFLDVMQGKLLATAREGQGIRVDIGLAQGVRTTFDDIPEGEESPLSDLLEMWVKETAHRSQFHVRGATSTRMMLEDVRLPPRDPRTGRTVGAAEFGAGLVAFFRSLGYSASRDVKGDAIFITVTGP